MSLAVLLDSCKELNLAPKIACQASHGPHGLRPQKVHQPEDMDCDLHETCARSYCVDAVMGRFFSIDVCSKDFSYSAWTIREDVFCWLDPNGARVSRCFYFSGAIHIEVCS